MDIIQSSNSNDDKIDNLLNLSTSVSKEDLNKSQELSIGYDSEERTWELIVKHTGDISVIYEYAEKPPVFLLGNYAIIQIKESRIRQFSNEKAVIFIEKPKIIFPDVFDGIAMSCVYEIQQDLGIYGEGVLVGIVDSGIDYTHDVFRNRDGSTRIKLIWDQNIEAQNVNNTSEENIGGTVYSEEEINRALNEANPYSVVPSKDSSGHGTHVAGIAAGNFASDKNNNVGMATGSQLIIVKLRRGSGSFYPGTVELMEGIDFIVRKAIELNMPLALNISYGNNYGSHDGTSLIETYIDYVASLGQISIAVGTGNEATGAVHELVMAENGTEHISEISVSNYEKSLNIQIWKYYEDIIDIFIESPAGYRYRITEEYSQQEIIIKSENVKMLIFSGEPKPYSQAQEIFIELIPQDMYISIGIWKIILYGRNIVDGRVDMYLQSAASLGRGTGFLRPNPITTLTIPSTASKVVSVGAYDARTGAYANFSGRGYTRVTNQIKPDIVAPGVNVLSATPGGGLESRSGTSMATPFVTGAMALLMEWGIVRGNDRYLYGEKLKAYLKRNATREQNVQYPNEKEGYGRLCVGVPTIRNDIF